MIAPSSSNGCLSSVARATLGAIVGWIGVAAAGGSVAAQEASGGPLLITLGGNAVFAPRYEGASRHSFGPWPIISWRRPGEKEWLDHPTDGLDFSLIETENFRMGPVGFLRWQRDNATIPARGFSRVGTGHTAIDLSLEGGIFAELWPAQWLRTRVELRESVVGARGMLAIFASDLVWRPDRAMTFSIGPRLTLADDRFMRSYYGVNAPQSVQSGLTLYNPDAGARSYGLSGLARYKLSEVWTTQVFAEYQRLTGPAGDSPVISGRGSTPDQYLVGAGISYTFVAPWER